MSGSVITTRQNGLIVCEFIVAPLPAGTLRAPAITSTKQLGAAIDAESVGHIRSSGCLLLRRQGKITSLFLPAPFRPAVQLVRPASLKVGAGDFALAAGQRLKAISLLAGTSNSAAAFKAAGAKPRRASKYPHEG
jgi:hypothetical protein